MSPKLFRKAYEALGQATVAFMSQDIICCLFNMFIEDRVIYNHILFAIVRPIS